MKKKNQFRNVGDVFLPIFAQYSLLRKAVAASHVR